MSTIRIPDSLLLLGGIGFVLAGIDNIFGLGLPIGYILAGIFIMYLGIKKSSVLMIKGSLIYIILALAPTNSPQAVQTWVEVFQSLGPVLSKFVIVLLIVGFPAATAFANLDILNYLGAQITEKLKLVLKISLALMGLATLISIVAAWTLLSAISSIQKVPPIFIQSYIEQSLINYIRYIIVYADILSIGLLLLGGSLIYYIFYEKNYFKLISSS